MEQSKGILGQAVNLHNICLQDSLKASESPRSVAPIPGKLEPNIFILKELKGNSAIVINL